MSGRAATTGIIPGRYAVCVGKADAPSPPGWAWTLLTDIARLETGHTPSRTHPEYWDGGEIQWIGIKDARLHHGRTILETIQKVTQLGIDNSAARVLPVGTVCLSRTASVGYVFVMGREMATSQDFVNWVCTDALLPDFLMYALMAEGEDIRRFGKGTTHTTIYFPEVKAFYVCVPPVNEQRRIVAKIEELFSNLDAGVAALKRAKANLKRYRAAVLKAAVEGKLTEAWRVDAASCRVLSDQDTRQDAASTYEPAAKLLERILTERRQKWEADQLAKFTAAGKPPPKGWREKYIEPSPPDTTGLPELPEGWCWARVEQLGDVQLGRQRSPKNRSDKFPTKYIRAANLTEAGLALDDILDMEFQPRELETYRLHPGDILLSEASGSPDQVGKPVVWNGEIENCCFQNTVIRLRPEGMPSAYPLTVFRYYYMNKLFAKVAAGVGINHLSAAKFSALPFPLAPLAEQKEIADDVDQRLSTIAVAVRQIEGDLLRAARLRQSILKQAFEGKLVPHDPGDEPASALLERLRANGDKMDDKSRTRRGRRVSKTVNLEE